MDLIKSWLDLVREFRSGQFWWSGALPACLADAYLLICFDVGLIEWIPSLPAFSRLEFDGGSALAFSSFVVAAAASWFYLLPLVVFPYLTKRGR